MNHTTNFNLSQFEALDPVKRSDFNADNVAIDTALQAGVTGRAALSGRIDSADAAIALLGTHGHNARIVTGSYAGDNRNGQANPCSITIDFYPVAMFVVDTRNAANSNSPTFAVRPFDRSHSTSGATINYTWNDKSVSWWGESPAAQNNRTGDTYYWMIIGYDKDAEEA